MAVKLRNAILSLKININATEIHVRKTKRTRLSGSAIRIRKAVRAQFVEVYKDLFDELHESKHHESHYDWIGTEAFQELVHLARKKIGYSQATYGWDFVWPMYLNYVKKYHNGEYPGKL